MTAAKEINRRTPWLSEDIKMFRDDNGTIFIKGPFTVDGIDYDCKLKDQSGEDYCTFSQMIDWDVRMKEVMNCSKMSSADLD